MGPSVSLPLLLLALGPLASALASPAPAPDPDPGWPAFRADGLLKAVELEVGEGFTFTLPDGATRRFRLLSASARPIWTWDRPEHRLHNGRVFAMECVLEADGQPLRFLRIVPGQQSFYTPVHVNGVTLFFDAAQAIEAFIHDNHGGSAATTARRSFPNRAARFAFAEYGAPLAGQPLRPWLPLPGDRLEIHSTYNGQNVWLGPYLKNEAHNGLDINCPAHTPLYAPIDFDRHGYFESLALGHNNNRWRGTRTWPNGETWTLRSHHMDSLVSLGDAPLTQGTRYGTVGGTLYGAHPHAHFFFIWQRGPDTAPIHLDPWILFWRTFENNRLARGEIRAEFPPLPPLQVGDLVEFDARQSRPGVNGFPLDHTWSTGDGAHYEGALARHRFLRPGVHLVTLTVHDGVQRARLTHHVTVLPAPETDPATLPPAPWLRVTGLDPADLPLRPPEMTDNYGDPVPSPANVLRIPFRHRQAAPPPRLLRLEGDTQTLRDLVLTVHHEDRDNWLRVERRDDMIRLHLVPANLWRAPGLYRARLELSAGPDLPVQTLRVEAEAPPDRNPPPVRAVRVPHREALRLPSAFPWVDNPYEWDFLGGPGSFTVWAGGDTSPGRLRYQPDLAPGRYRVALATGSTLPPPFTETPRPLAIDVEVRTPHGTETLRWTPASNRVLGEFEFGPDRSSWVDLLAPADSSLLIADALEFVPVEP
jgi:hypothetical protein